MPIVQLQEKTVDAIFHPNFVAWRSLDQSPDFARLAVGETFIEKLLKTRSQCVDLGAKEIRIEMPLDAWDTQEFMERAALQDPQMVVTPNEFWFKDTPGGSVHCLETQAVSIDDFLAEIYPALHPKINAALKADSPQSAVYFGDPTKRDDVMAFYREDRLNREAASVKPTVRMRA